MPVQSKQLITFNGINHFSLALNSDYSRPVKIEAPNMAAFSDQAVYATRKSISAIAVAQVSAWHSGKTGSKTPIRWFLLEPSVE
jgi:hypothetical protein